MSCRSLNKKQREIENGVYDDLPKSQNLCQSSLYIET